jgi:hypothetical protein
MDLSRLNKIRNNKMRINKIILETTSRKFGIIVLNKEKIIIFVTYAVVCSIRKRNYHGEDFVLVAITLYAIVALI